MKARRFFLGTVVAGVCLSALCVRAGQSTVVYPGKSWDASVYRPRFMRIRFDVREECGRIGRQDLNGSRK